MHHAEGLGDNTIQHGPYRMVNKEFKLNETLTDTSTYAKSQLEGNKVIS